MNPFPIAMKQGSQETRGPLSGKSTRTQASPYINRYTWHPAFVVALKALLIDYSDVLEYKLEHPFTTGSLSIDILVVKKRPDVVIRRQIAEIFRQENIVEYKSPTDSLSVNEFLQGVCPRPHI